MTLTTCMSTLNMIKNYIHNLIFGRNEKV